VTCAPLREAGLDYLRDRAASGGRPGAVRGRMDRLAAGSEAGQPMTLNGLRTALVLEADICMLDEARLPLVVARDVDRAQERLLYEQALELARALEAGTDFHVGAGGVELGDTAAALLARLATPLGGTWAAAERREALVRLALEALHWLERDEDYRVDQGRVLLPQRPPEEADAHAERDAMLQMLIEVKEGCRTSPRREVVARMSVPGFLGRYLHLAGACADARGLETEFWKHYRLKTVLAGRRRPALVQSGRVFANGHQRQAALRAELGRAAAAGEAVLLAVRTPAVAHAAAELLAAAGVPGAGIAQYPLPGTLSSGLPVSVLVVELHDAQRHLAHLCALHGATHYSTFLALDEETVRTALGELAARWLARFAGADGELPASLAAMAVRRAQRGMERAQAALRDEVASRDQYLRDLLAFSGGE
jgi:preprotein translocase subunit SecA